MLSKEFCNFINPSHRAQEGCGRGESEGGRGGEGGGGTAEEVCGEEEEVWGEAKEEWGEVEEVRGVVGLGRADGEGRREGGWCNGGASGLSSGAKPSEFPMLSNHSTLHAHGEDRGGRSGVEA
jgi:hypothetical protein